MMTKMAKVSILMTKPDLLWVVLIFIEPLNIKERTKVSNKRFKTLPT
jgi:hypothetical protein